MSILSLKPIKRKPKVCLANKIQKGEKLLISGKVLPVKVYAHPKDEYSKVLHLDVEGVDVEMPGKQVGGVMLSGRLGTRIFLIKPIKINGKEVKDFYLKDFWFLKKGERVSCRIGKKETGMWIGMDKKGIEALSKML